MRKKFLNLYEGLPLNIRLEVERLLFVRIWLNCWVKMINSIVLSKHQAPGKYKTAINPGSLLQDRRNLKIKYLIWNHLSVTLGKCQGIVLSTRILLKAGIHFWINLGMVVFSLPIFLGNLTILLLAILLSHPIKYLVSLNCIFQN